MCLLDHVEATRCVAVTALTGGMACSAIAATSRTSALWSSAVLTSGQVVPRVTVGSRGLGIRLDAYCPVCSNDSVDRGRILALDYGTKNVGLASSDELGITVRPLPSLPNVNRRDLMRRLKTAVRDNAIDSLVVGIPMNMDGSAGAAVQGVQRFIEALRREFGLPLWTVDERLSTVEALEIWRGMSTRRQRRYRTVDSLAAALILERLLRES